MEEVIALKLDLSTRTLGSPLYGLPLWSALPDIVGDAVLKFAVSTTRTSSEAARVLGLTQDRMAELIKKFGIKKYFGEGFKYSKIIKPTPP